MYSIFTYIYHRNPTKCRLIYHTWMVWLIIPSTSTQPSPAFRWCCHHHGRCRSRSYVSRMLCCWCLARGFLNTRGFWWMRGVYGTGSTCTSLMLFFSHGKLRVGLWLDYDYVIAMIGMVGWVDSCDGFDGSKSEGDDIVQFASSFNKKMASNWWFHFVLQLIARSARWSLFPAPKIGEQWSAATNIFPEKILLGRWNSF